MVWPKPKCCSTHLQKPKEKKRKKGRRVRAPSDTDEDDEDYDDEGNVIAKQRPGAITRFRRACRRGWFNFKERYLTATKRKRMAGWRQVVFDQVNSMWFNNIMTAFIILNTITLALDHYGISDTMIMVLENINLGELSLF